MAHAIGVVIPKYRVYNDIDIIMEIDFGEIFGHGGWLIGPKLFDPKLYLVCASSKLCEFMATTAQVSFK